MRRYLMIRLALLVLVIAVARPAAAQEVAVASQVNGDPISSAAFHARVRLVRWQYLREIETLYEATGGNLQLTGDYVTNLVASLNDPIQLGNDVLHEMEEERLLWQAGEEFGVTPAAEDAQAQEDNFFSLWTNVPVDQLAASEDAQAFKTDWYATATAMSGMSENDIRFLFETEALRINLYAYLAQSVPAEELAVESRHILCSFHPDNPADLTPPTPEQREAAETCIQAAQLRLASGEAFGVVAADLSVDQASAVQGGNVGWMLLSYLAEGYANAVRDADLNTVIGPVETEFGLHLIEVLDHRMQQLTAEEFQNSVSGYFRLWVQTLWDTAIVVRSAGWDAAIPVDPGLDILAPSIRDAVDTLVAPGGE
jgi:hypothetical protein